MADTDQRTAIDSVMFSRMSSRKHFWNSMVHPAGQWRRPYFNNPNTATPLVVPTYTCPCAIIGVMNLFPAPKVSLVPD